MDPVEKIDFVSKNQSGDYFDKDAELYRKTFPASKLNIELANANEFTKYDLDGRILMELLDSVSPEEILDNRGIKVISFEGKTTEEIQAIIKEQAEQFLINLDLEGDVDYDKIKKLAKDLSIKPKNQKKTTLIKALTEVKVKLVPGEEDKSGDSGSGSEGQPDTDKDKKSEGDEEGDKPKDDDKPEPPADRDTSGDEKPKDQDKKKADHEQSTQQ